MDVKINLYIIEFDQFLEFIIIFNFLLNFIKLNFWNFYFYNNYKSNKNIYKKKSTFIFILRNLQ